MDLSCMESERLRSEASIVPKTTSNTSGIIKIQVTCMTKEKARKVETRLGMERRSLSKLTPEIGRLSGMWRAISKPKLQSQGN